MNCYRNSQAPWGRFGKITLTLVSAALMATACGALTVNLSGRGKQATPPVEGPPPLVEDKPEPTVVARRTPDFDSYGRRMPGEPNATKVALLVPLTGPHAATGRDILDADHMAMFDLADVNFEILPHDTHGTKAGAEAAVNEALAEGAQLVLGPLLSSSVAAVAPFTRGVGVNVVTFSNDLSVAGDGVYALGYAPQYQLKRVIDYARSQGMTKFAMLAPSSAYGVAMVEAMESSVPGFGAEITDIALYSPEEDHMNQVVRDLADYDQRHRALLREREALKRRGDTGARAMLRRLETQQTLGDVDFDAVFLPAGGSEVLRLSPLLAYYDIDPAQVKLLGTWLWDDPGLRTEPAMVGAWFAAPPPEAREGFVADFRRLYGRAPSRRATLGYDAVAMAAVLAGRARGRLAFSRDAMAAPNGFAGKDGIFRLAPSGVVERGLAVLEIQRSGVRVVDPAPASFDEISEYATPQRRSNTFSR